MPVFDSNIVIYHLNDALPPAALPRIAAWIAAGATISVMTRIEVLGYPQTAAQLQQATDFLRYLTECRCPKRLCSAPLRSANSTASAYPMR